MLLDAAMVSTRLGISTRTAVTMFRSRELRAMRVGDLWRTDENAVMDYIRTGLGERFALVDFTAKEVAGLLNVSAKTVLRLFAADKIRAMRVNGKLWRTNRELVDRYLHRGLHGPISTPKLQTIPEGIQEATVIRKVA